MFDILQYPFIQNALIAGSLVAIVAAIAGYFLIIRGLTFAAHALPNIGFAGAAGAVLVGISPEYGLFAFTIIAGIAIGLLGKQVRERDIAVGIMMVFALGLGFLFLSLYAGYAEQVYSILFGTVLGISRADVLVTALFCFITILFFLLIFRPLLFSSLDPLVAEARSVPVLALTLCFFILVAITISLSVQIVGALLVFVLLIGPPATALRIVQRPILVIGIGVLLGIIYTWLGILCAANGIGISGSDAWPVSFYIATLSFFVYLLVRVISPIWLGNAARTLAEQRGENILVTRPIDKKTEIVVNVWEGSSWTRGER